MAATEPGAFPGCGGLCEPELMLQAETFQFGGVSAQDVFFLTAHVISSSVIWDLSGSRIVVRRAQSDGGLASGRCLMFRCRGMLL